MERQNVRWNITRFNETGLGLSKVKSINQFSVIMFVLFKIRLTCESPTSDYDPRSSSKTSRTKRTSAGGNARCSNQQSLSLFQQVTSNNHLSALDDRKLRNNIKSRQSKRLNNLPTNVNEEVANNSPPFRTANNQTFFPSETTTASSNSSEPQLLTCSEPQCHKRFASNLALSYHLSDAHKKVELTPLSSIPQVNTRDEEDVAHILANVADYVRRSSPPASIRSSPEHPRSTLCNSPPSHFKPLENPSTLSWPCPQISSKLVLASPLNQILSPDSTKFVISSIPPTTSRCFLFCRCKFNNADQDDLKTSITPADHFLLPIQDEPMQTKVASPPNYLDSNNSKTSSPPPPPTSSSPAYSDISDEDPLPNEHVSFPPSTINLLAQSNGKIDENGHNLHSSFLTTNSGLNNSDISNPAWTAQMLFQQFGSFIQPQTLVTEVSTSPNR